jgi:hypothetical protein
MEEKMISKRVAVRAALVTMLLVLLAAALPLSASAQGWISGHVWDISNNRGVLGATTKAVVELYRNGVLWKTSTCVSGNADWGFLWTGQAGEYTIKLKSLPTDYVYANLTLVAISVMEKSTGRVLLRRTVMPDSLMLALDPLQPVGNWAINFECTADVPVVPVPQQPAWSYITGVVYDGNTNIGVPGVRFALLRNDNGVWVPVTQMDKTGILVPVTFLSGGGDTDGTFGAGVSYRPWTYRIEAISVPAGFAPPAPVDFTLGGEVTNVGAIRLF